MGIRVRVLLFLAGVVLTVVFARRNGVTQTFLAKPPKRSIPLLTKVHMVMKVVRLAKDMQVTVVADRRRTAQSAD